MRNLWKFIPAFLVTILIYLNLVDGFVALVVFLVFCWLFVPAIIVSIYFTIASCRLRDRWQKGLFAWGVFNVLFFGASLIHESRIQQCDAFFMAKHYEKNKKEMDELAKYADRALDDSIYVHLEFEDGEVAMFHISSKGDSYIRQSWDYEAVRRKDYLMSVVGLTPEEYEEISHRLDRMGCIGIAKDTSHPNGKTVIYFRRVLMGMYSFILFDNPINQEEKDRFMKGGEYIPFSDRVIFQYGGGAFGKQYFTKDEREEFLSKHQPW